MSAGAPPPAVLPDGFRALHLEETASTNAAALGAAQAGEPGGLWITARRQTAGRGRQGRVWTSDEGNLFASLLLRDPVRPERLGELPLVIALGVHDTVAGLLAPLQRGDLAIKWPNDLVFRGAKLAGILLEGGGDARSRVVVVGIGVNCRHFPSEIEYPATSLAAIGVPASADEVFGVLAAAVARRLGEWRLEGFEAVRTAWLARARGLGETIRVRMPARTLEGRFEALDAAGRLQLRLADGRIETISAGDVFFGTAAGAGATGGHA